MSYVLHVSVVTNVFELYGLQKYNVLQSAGAFRLDLLPPSPLILSRVSK
jgi:hypothetical protein